MRDLRRICPPADHGCAGELSSLREMVIFSVLVSCLSAAVPLSTNFGSSKEELYPSACSDPGSVSRSAPGQRSSQSCCLSFPFYLQVVFPAFKYELLRAGTVSHTSTSCFYSVAPLFLWEGSSSAPRCAPRPGGCSVRGFGMCLGRKGWMSRDRDGDNSKGGGRGEIWPRAAEHLILGRCRKL